MQIQIEFYFLFLFIQDLQSHSIFLRTISFSSLVLALPASARIKKGLLIGKVRNLYKFQFNFAQMMIITGMQTGRFYCAGG